MKPLIVPFFISHQGCPHRCVFCDQRTISGRGGEFPADEELRAAVAAAAVSRGGRPVEVAFYGGTFTSIPRTEQQRLLGVLQPLLAAQVIASVRISTRPDAVDGESARFLRDHGVTTVELGVQSMDDRVLAASGRGHNAADTERAFSVLREEGIAVGAQLMPGLPGDTAESSLASLRRVLSLGPSCLRIYPTVVVEGTELAELWRCGRYTPLERDAAVSLCARMLRLATEAGVPVIRIGLQPTEELEAPGTILAGPWHSAFRQLVEGELWCELLLRLTDGIPPGSGVRLICAPTRVSDVVGQRRRNLERLATERGVRVVRVDTVPAFPPFDLEISHSGGTVTGSLFP
ncbi:elongator complex protein 3 [Geobacter pickeringii]|uniref:Radical SAM protein n=1 Tax=Geobacter pickeringii TaxID=345632 RepID=A0A0B5BAE5_9BACT|nr:radical SAM protein [Geobacter pickeringii]AJE03688.1 radical SAM protein [Geobacter pickeringii]